MGGESQSITFTAEIKKVDAKTLVSLDKEYRCTLASSDASLLSLGLVGADKTVRVTVEVVE